MPELEEASDGEKLEYGMGELLVMKRALRDQIKDDDLEVKVNRRVLMSFPIGRYHDKVMCESIISYICGAYFVRKVMAICRKVMHVGEEEKRLREIESEREKSEVTSSEKNSRATGKKRKIVFERIEKSKVNFFVKESELKSAVVEGQPMILLVYKESLLNLDKSNTPLRSLVTFLLQEFEDMFSEDMPNKLPLFEVSEGINEQGVYEEEYESICLTNVTCAEESGTCKICVDCQAINNITVKYHHHNPRLDDILNELHRSCIFSKMDLKSKFVVVYFDDILVYSKNLNEHKGH
ncbi:uncharacterized protein LOC111388606 [Olea europaea var. sylvestris]|uniref:uncharacterized protein LOC111388606 n=1 Tax=Olea europaea var. sylvestris TaxID=158386 RepID=UPI000C1D7727|nr:uncharacterized protein LOC111388606 [Olea europaea var. sylvestris]